MRYAQLIISHVIFVYDCLIVYSPGPLLPPDLSAHDLHCDGGREVEVEKGIPGRQPGAAGSGGDGGLQHGKLTDKSFRTPFNWV